MNHTKKTAATMSDVAREAGVALGTVSKVINGQSVGESYRLKVEGGNHRKEQCRSQGAERQKPET